MLQNASNRELSTQKSSVSEILNALDMVGAVHDIRRFNYVAKIVKLIINEKLTQLSGNGQRTLFMIVKVMLNQVIKSKENMNVMKNLLNDFKKKLQNSYYYYFYYIGSQQLWEKHLSTISKWQHILEYESNKKTNMITNDFSLMSIPNDCKMEILRRLNNGLDLVNLAKCNKAFNSIVTKELSIWKSLCLFHYQQSNINLTLNKANTNKDSNKLVNNNELDWKSLYFRLKRRYGNREVYVDMIHKCNLCKGLFWKEIGHDCILSGDLEPGEEASSEPITPNKLINILLL
jgi:F-box protein 25/32